MLYLDNLTNVKKSQHITKMSVHLLLVDRLLHAIMCCVRIIIYIYIMYTSVLQFYLQQIISVVTYCGVAMLLDMRSSLRAGFDQCH